MVALAACSQKPTSFEDAPAEAGTLKACEEPEEPNCARSSCGANSPTVNTFPTNGVRSDGECNNDGVQLMPASVRGGAGGKCNGTTLTVRDNKLITIHPKDRSPVCVDTELEGASFVLRSWVKKDGKYGTLTVHIADIIPEYHADTTHHPRTAYRLTDDQGVSLCTAKGSTEARSKQLGLKALTDLTDPDPSRDVAIPVRSELYDRDGHALRVLSKWHSGEAEWLQFACANDALGERSLYGLHSDDVATSRAALMMFMANYCGDFHATAPGTKIEWEIADASKGPPAGSTMLEARWGPDGAICVAAPRALYRDGPSPTAPHDPQGDLLKMKDDCPGCTTPEAWANEMRRCKTMRARRQPPAPRPTCDECKSPECAGVMLHSYLVPKTMIVP
ncbi:MAG: ADYC domain-containing protein [Kofleriaceae bacterium]